MTVEQVVAVMHQNSANACRVVRAAIHLLPQTRTCACATAAQFAIMTAPDAIPVATREKLSLLYGKYLKVSG